MKYLNCIVIDDDIKFVESLELQLKNISFVQLIDKCSSYGESILSIKKHTKIYLTARDK